MRFNLTCPKCGGSGQLRDACPTCAGEGRIVTPETVEVRLPAGVHSGDRLRVAGKGNAGSMGAPAGDLYITVRVEEHPFFRREGDDIHITVPITVWEAGLGTKIEVPTLDGRSVLKIPQGTQNLQKFRLRDKGVSNSRSAGDVSPTSTQRADGCARRTASIARTSVSCPFHALILPIKAMTKASGGMPHDRRNTSAGVRTDISAGSSPLCTVMRLPKSAPRSCMLRRTASEMQMTASRFLPK